MPAVHWQGFFYNRYEPPAESKGGPGTETSANKDQQVRTCRPFLQLPTSTVQNKPLKQIMHAFMSKAMSLLD